MKAAARLTLGLCLVPACCAAALSLWDAIVVAAGATGGLTPEALSLLGGIAAFACCWMALSHPVKTYVLGHELTHAIWGVMFGAKASDVRVTENGGSVRLTKSNMLITLAPYFFPFYTFVVIVAALVTYAFLRPLPCLPLWLFLLGFTWAFHALFTVQTLMQRQPDIKEYGRLFSWTFIFLANVALVLLWLVLATPMTFGQLWSSLLSRFVSAYVSVGAAAAWLWKLVARLCTRT